MGEDRKRAQEMATQDLKNLVQRVVTGPGQIIASDNEADWPDDDGAGVSVPVGSHETLEDSRAYARVFLNLNGGIG
jgi:hypothetical protein